MQNLQIVTQDSQYTPSLAYCGRTCASTPKSSSRARKHGTQCPSLSRRVHTSQQTILYILWIIPPHVCMSCFVSQVPCVSPRGRGGWGYRRSQTGISQRVGRVALARQFVNRVSLNTRPTVGLLRCMVVFATTLQPMTARRMAPPPPCNLRADFGSITLGPTDLPQERRGGEGGLGQPNTSKANVRWIFLCTENTHY